MCVAESVCLSIWCETTAGKAFAEFFLKRPLSIYARKAVEFLVEVSYSRSLAHTLIKSQQFSSNKFQKIGLIISHFNYVLPIVISRVKMKSPAD